MPFQLLPKIFSKKPDKKERVFDPHPKIKVDGDAYITKVTLSKIARRNTYEFVDEQIIFSHRPVSKEEILNIPMIVEFIEKNPRGLIEKEEYHCTLNSVRNMPIYSEEIKLEQEKQAQQEQNSK